MQSAQRGTIGLQHEHRSLVAAVDGDLAAAVNHDRLVHQHRSGIEAGLGLERPAGGSGIDQLLEGHQGMDARVALVERHQSMGLSTSTRGAVLKSATTLELGGNTR